MKPNAAYAVALILFAITALCAENDKPAPGLKNTTVLIIRHAEKPENGRDLSPEGQKRADAYAEYFKNFKVDGKALVPDCLFATADSEESQRPRQTLEPLSKALNLKIDSSIKNKNFPDVVKRLQSKHHGDHILISWHHGEIPELLQAFGVNPATLLPEGKWPKHEFAWVLLLHFDQNGHLIPADTKRIPEALMPGDPK